MILTCKFARVDPDFLFERATTPADLTTEDHLLRKPENIGQKK